MGVYKVAKDLQQIAINTPTVSQSCYGNIELYNNKAIIKYPYINFDVVSSRIINFTNQYTFRIYAVDRNERATAYNKTKLIVDLILKYYTLDINNYTLNYFTLNFKDMVDGCWSDFIVEQPLDNECLNNSLITSGFTIQQNMGIYEIKENLVNLAKSVNMVGDAGFGDINLYDNKATIKYPYCNFNLINSPAINGMCAYTFRLQVLDRNEPYIAYNKTELILNTILKHHYIDANNYTIRFVNLVYKDIVNGCEVDFTIETNIPYNCLLSDSESTFIITEDGDYIITEVSEDYVIKE